MTADSAPPGLTEYLNRNRRRFARAAIAQNVAGECRLCGCTEERACTGGCFWVEPDLCNRCQEADAA